MGKGEGCSLWVALFQISHHCSLTEMSLVIITVILCCQAVRQNAYADIFICLQYCLAVGDFLNMKLVNSGLFCETVVSWILWYVYDHDMLLRQSHAARNRTKGWVRRSNGCWVCFSKHRCRDVKIQPLKIACWPWSSYILSMELHQP